MGILALVTILGSAAGASPLGDLLGTSLLNNAVVNKMKNKMTTQVSITVQVDNSALWDKPLPYYLVLFKFDGSGEKMMESYMLALESDALQKNLLTPITHDKTKTIFEHNSTIFPGDYAWVLDRKPIFTSDITPAKTEWYLPKLQYFSIDAKPVDRHISFAIKGFPSVQDKTENQRPADKIEPTAAEEPIEETVVTEDVLVVPTEKTVTTENVQRSVDPTL